jgi:serine/threonine protein kinase
LKPENVFVDEEGYCKIGDFGLSIPLDISSNESQIKDDDQSNKYDNG